MLPQWTVELADVAIPQEGEAQEQAVWRVLSERSLYQKGTKAHIGRYGAVVWEGLSLLKAWNCCLFDASVPSAEGQLINKNALCRVKLRTSGADDATHCGPIGTSSLQEADRTFRSCGVNAMACTMAILSDSKNKRFLALICNIPIPVTMWTNTANTELWKCVVASQKWLLEQTEGKLYSTLWDVFGQLLDPEMLHDGLFMTNRTVNVTSWSEEAIDAEDTLANLAGRMATRCVMHMARRLLYLFAPPTIWF